MVVCVISKNGERLTPTGRLGKVRHLLESGDAVIVSYKPCFTIQLTYDTPGHVPDVEACMDTGYEHIGCSVKSEQCEYLSEQRDLLTDEKERHDDRRKYRRSRRGRLRNRAPRFNNRRRTKGKDWKKLKGVCQRRQDRKNAKRRAQNPVWYETVDTVYANSKAEKKPVKSKIRKQLKEQRKALPEKESKTPSVPQTESVQESPWKPVEAAKVLAPSIRNKADRHVDLLIAQVLCFPVKNLYVEMGEFDTVVMKALAEGTPIPEGVDYQYGKRYGIESLRSAVFARDGHKCVFCGRGIAEKAELHAHHAYFWRGQHGNSLDELVSCCEKCHTHANHQPGGLLWGYDKGLASYAAPAFMNSVRYYIIDSFKSRLEQINRERQEILDRIASGEQMPESDEVAPLQPVPMPEIHLTYGAATKIARKDLNLEKSHVNDAYAMGLFHPSVRAEEQHYQKRRRNNRILAKFYDARYVDSRDCAVKTGAELSCGRTNRKYPRNSDLNQRIYHRKKVRKGRVSQRTQRYPIQPGTIVMWKRKKRVTTGSKNLGKQIAFKGDYDPVKKKCRQLVASTSKVKVICYPSGWVRV